MNQILVTNDNIFVSNDRFIVDNMLTDEDLDLELSPYAWNDLSSNDSSSCDLTTSIDISINSCDVNTSEDQMNALNGLTPPETPPSSDRSSPPNFADLSTIIPSEQTSHHLLPQNKSQLSNVTLLPAMTSCPSLISPVSPLSPFIPNETSMLAMRAQNGFNLNNNVIHNKNNIKTCINNNSITYSNSYTGSNINTNTNTNTYNSTNSTNSNNNHNRNTSANCGDNKLHLSQLKREARKLRNREAACISRKRKKEYVDSLELRINGLLKENADLRLENQRLKHKMADLEEDKNHITKQGFHYSIESNCNCRSIWNTSGSNKKATLSLLAVIFMLGLNLAPFSGVLITNDKSISNVESNLKQDFVKHGPSRSLLWETTNEDQLAIDVMTAPERAFNSSYGKANDTDCKTYINQTESLRLETDLRDWLLRVNMEKEEVSKQKRLIKSNKLKDRFNKQIPLPRLKAWMQKRAQNSLNDINDYAIESYDNSLGLPPIKYQDLLSAIHRRDDTFYFLSFSIRDHLIIPPLSNNASDIRPRFSLIMPSVNTLNESSSQGTNVTYHQILMMQIDCEVINTKMVLINSSPNSKSSSDSGVKKISVRNNGKSKSVLGSKNNKTNGKMKVQ